MVPIAREIHALANHQDTQTVPTISTQAESIASGVHFHRRAPKGGVKCISTLLHFGNVG